MRNRPNNYRLGFRASTAQLARPHMQRAPSVYRTHLHAETFCAPGVKEMNNDEKGRLRERTKAFALRTVRLYSALPKTTEAQVLGKQLLRSGTSVGAHYREASHARSQAEFVSKMEVSLQELDETAYWIELLVEAGILTEARLASLQQEASELMAMIASSIITAKSRKLDR